LGRETGSFGIRLKFEAKNAAAFGPNKPLFKALAVFLASAVEGQVLA
jgi:hypothetical protein